MKEIHSLIDLELAFDEMRSAFISKHKISYKIDEGYRTSQQNKAIHVYCSMIASKCKSAGIDFIKMLEALEAEIPATGDKVKEDIWRPIQIAAIGKKSTTKLKPKEVTDVYEIVNRFTCDKLGFGIRFPSYDGREYQD